MFTADYLRLRRFFLTLGEAARLSIESMWAGRLRSFLAISGVVIGIVTVVLVASVLANLRDQIALLFRELGTENIFAFHISGDPYQEPSESEINRTPLKLEFAREIARRASAVREVGTQVIVPPIVNGRALTARAGANESDTVLVEGSSSNFFEIVGAEFKEGRPFTDLEERSSARVAVIGPAVASGLFGEQPATGKTFVLGGESYFVVGVLAPRKGGFFGENRQDRVLTIPAATARQRFSEADKVVLYIRAKPGLMAQAQSESEFILRQLRQLKPDEPADFTLSTAESIIRTFDQISAQIGLVTIALAAVSLVIGGIGIANIMIISVTERTREIGVRLALGARRKEVLTQFLFEAGILSGIGGITGVSVALLVGLSLKLVLTGFSAVPPAWAVISGVAASVCVGVVAGYYPARRASFLDPVEALRHE